jgi:hypothetical protein
MNFSVVSGRDIIKGFLFNFASRGEEYSSGHPSTRFGRLTNHCSGSLPDLKGWSSTR